MSTLRSVRFAACLGLFALGVFAPVGAAPASAPDRMNVVVFLIDDMGASDVGCFGNTFIETPNIDRLARDGVRLTTGYSACTVCSPSRAALMTGQYPARLHVTDWISGHKRPFAKLRVPDWTMYLPAETFTIANAFHTAGYATASIGKWHLGGPEYYPEKHGFDVNIAGSYQGSPPGYFATEKFANLPPGPPGAFLPDRLTEEAVKFIDANRDRPFFLYFPHYAVHQPIAGKPEVVAKYAAKARAKHLQANPTYAALVEAVDGSVGAVRKALADRGLAEKTIVVFMSDNGGLLPVTSNPPYRAGKGSAYEGGVRVPWIVLWPGATRPGTSVDTPAITCDLFPTLVEACGLSVPASHTIDGRSLAGLLKGTGRLDREALYWHYPHYHPGGATPYSAVRLGDWRLVEFFEDGRLELYDLKHDVGETTDLATREPELTRKLHERLKKWREEVGAQLPTANPDYDPARARVQLKTRRPAR